MEPQRYSQANAEGQGKDFPLPPACKRWRVGAPELLYTSLCSWLFQQQGGDPCHLQHLAGTVLCLSAALPHGSARFTLAQEQQETSRVLLLCLLESSPQLGSGRRCLCCCVPVYRFCSLGLGLWRTSEGVGLYFPFLVGGKGSEEDGSNLGDAGAGILVSAASVCSEHPGSVCPIKG